MFVRLQDTWIIKLHSNIWNVIKFSRCICFYVGNCLTNKNIYVFLPVSCIVNAKVTPFSHKEIRIVVKFSKVVILGFLFVFRWREKKNTFFQARTHCSTWVIEFLFDVLFSWNAIGFRNASLDHKANEIPFNPGRYEELSEKSKSDVSLLFLHCLINASFSTTNFVTPATLFCSQC